MTINLTDPANHPANGPLTAERIERVIEALEINLTYSNGSSMDHVLTDAVKGLKELLVSKEAAREPVGNDELDQMIWKLERDGMTPKLLSLMRELRERRKADGWIPVSDRMPENATGVLVASPWQCAPGGYAMKWATLCPGHPDADSDGWIIPGASWSPTHWHTLPAAPKEVG